MSYGSRTILGILAVALLPVVAAAQITSETVSFQQGVNGYTGTVNIGIADSPGTTGTPPPFLDGSLAANPRIDIDGYGTTGTPPIQNSWDRHLLIRFDNIVGYEAGRIPPNATILSARLRLITGGTSNDQSPGPVGVAKLLKPFDLNTRWTDPFGTDGPDLAGGDFDWPVGGYEGCALLSEQITDVTPIVQAWANGDPNYGFILMTGNNTDAWAPCTTGNTVVDRHPKLIVEFARTRSRTIIFQQGVNGYTGTSMLRVQIPTTANPNGLTQLGTAITNGAYLDGGTSWTDALIKFDGVFGTGQNQVPPNTTILKAFLALTTSPKSGAPGGATLADSRGRWDVHRMLMDVDWTGTDPSKPFLWPQFLGADGPTEADGEIGPTLVSAEGMIWNARPWVDVTSVVQAWKSGEPNYGLAILPGTHDNQDGTPPDPTGDGWKFYWLGTGVPARCPQLILVVPSARADISGDGYVNQTDMDLFEPCAAASGPAIPYTGGCSAADLDNDRDVDQADYGIIQACISGTELASPECR